MRQVCAVIILLLEGLWRTKRSVGNMCQRVYKAFPWAMNPRSLGGALRLQSSFLSICRSSLSLRPYSDPNLLAGGYQLLICCS